MKAVVQRVLSASVTVDSQVVSEIGKGLLVFAAIGPDDTAKDVETLAGRILKLKVWDAATGDGRWKRSVLDTDYQVLMVSQFTLLASTKKGNKPDFHGACPPTLAKDMYQSLLDKTRELYVKEKKISVEEGLRRVQDGVFGAMMQVGLVNDGPVTFEISTPPKEAATADKVDKSGPKMKKPRSSGRSQSATPTTEEAGATAANGPPETALGQ